jgi:transposase InsO family protein
MARSEIGHYTAQEKRDAVKLGAELGTAEAADRLGMPQGTLSCWRHKARKAAKAGDTWPPSLTSGEEVSEREVAMPSKRAASSDVSQKRRQVAKMYTPSQRTEALELVAKVGVSAAHRQTGISRYSLYAWRRKVDKAARGEGESPTVGPDPKSVEAKRDEEILSVWRKHPGLGPSQVRNQLRRSGVRVSTHTVRHVMEDAGYRPPKVHRREHTGSFEAVRPSHMWHLDFVQRWIGRASTFTLILIDDHSRFVVGHGVDDAERADLVIDTFEQAVTRYGRPEMVMHDKGSAFWSWKGISRFSRLLEEMGIEQIVAEAKEWNGKIEVFNANIQKELFNKHRFYDIGEMKRRLTTHLHWYNHRRTHHALGGLLVPADRFYGRVDEVMARIEAGVAADATDVLDLRERVLDLFKVVSTHGKAEVWLMEQRVL